MTLPIIPLAIVAVLVTGCARAERVQHPAAITSFILAGEFTIPAGTSIAALEGARFGGVSGIVPLENPCELLGISDDSENSRLFRLRLSGAAPGFRVTPLSVIPLEGAPGAPSRLDPEGIALARSGNVLVSSEGIGDREPRVPPAIVEYTLEGRFVRQLPVPARFIPNERGALTTGVRQNAGFEALAISPDFTRLFTANEVPLAQDGPEDAFAGGQRVRLIEYVAEGKNYRPGREFAYDIAPLARPSYAVGYSVNGLVELLALSATDFLALERGYIRSEDERQSLNRIRLFRISLADATDVSGFDTLFGQPDVRPVQKTLVTDLNSLPGLSPALRTLDNFEGLAWVGSDGGAPLMVVSDDNFNPSQVTAFLLLQPPGSPPRFPVCG